MTNLSVWNFARAITVFAISLVMPLTSFATESSKAQTAPDSPSASPAPKKEKSSSKKQRTPKLPAVVKSLTTEDLVPGSGSLAEKGKTLKVHYTGWLYDAKAPEGKGKEFDTSVGEGKKPFEFKLGAGYVIKGWDEGFTKMKAGGKRRLIIPSEMGYGARGAGDAIPPNSALVFEIELLEVI